MGSYNKVMQVHHVNRGITLPVLEGLQCENSKIYKNMQKSDKFINSVYIYIYIYIYLYVIEFENV